MNFDIACLLASPEPPQLEGEPELNVARCAIPGLMWAANSSERAKVPGCACDRDD